MWTHTPVARLGLAAGLSLAVTTFLYVTVIGPKSVQPAAAAPKAAVVTSKRPVPAYTKLGPDDVVIIDSFSHFCMGTGGTLDIANGRVQGGWDNARPIQNALVD